ncbi:MAG: RNA ligase RtcB family protein [Planktomarina sp.]
MPLHHFYSAASWVEGRAITQAEEVCKWPGVTHVATFPDLHPGRYGPVGAAITADRIFPQLVGGDIGCGMSVFLLDLDRRKLKLEKAAKRLRTLGDPYDPLEDIPASYQGETASLGTIGGGNHFCELQEVESVTPGVGVSKGQMLLMVHSGSRGFGAGLFQSIKDRWADGFDPESEAGQVYIDMHDKAMEYAALNRHLIALRAARSLRAKMTPFCDAPHNFLSFEDGMWLHRKGSASTAVGGLIPLAGSRQSHSYLMTPLRDAPAQALASMAHGAGRKYDRSSMHGRVRAKRSDVASMERNPFGGRVICEDKDLLVEESGCAYKSAAQVSKDLADAGIAEIAATLRPIITFKKVRDHG